MRLLVTVVSPATRRSTDVVLHADPATPMTAVAAELERFARGDVGRGDVGRGDVGRGDGRLGRGAGASSAVALYVDCQRIWRRLTLAESPIRDGSVISLGSPDGCVVPPPSGLVDILVTGGHSDAGFGAGIMVVLDGARRLRSLPGIGQLLLEGPQVGVYAVCLDDSERLLPAECQAVAVFGRDGLRVEQTTAETVGGVRADHADPGWCARVARSLAPIRDDGRRRPVVAAGAQRPTALTPPTEVWVASVEWSALGRPEPVPPAARRRGHGGTIAGAGMILV